MYPTTLVTIIGIFSTSLLALATFFFAAPGVQADIYVYRDLRGVLHFSNVPNHSGYRALVRETGAGSRVSSPSGDRFAGIIRTASERYGVDPHLVQAVIKVESDFQSEARSRKGAQGLMQLMPETARLHNVNNAYDPHDNIDGGVRHLRLLLDRYQGDLRLSLAAYNAGIKAVEKHQGVPPFAETREYIRRVMAYLDRYRRKNGIVSISGQAKRRE
ncbi:MAG: transglycosylase SLT domain-containing protein [Candidatus Binatia bacterium]